MMDSSLSLQQVLAVFATYNVAIWPMQAVAYVLGSLAAVLAIRPIRHSSTIVAAALSFYWLWTGVVFYLFFWAPSYPPAYALAPIVVLQGAVFLVLGVLRARLSFRFLPGIYGLVGALVLAYAMVGYPVAGYFLGHVYPRTPPFGLVLCPTTVFTFGLLLWTDRPVPKYVLLVPFLASIGAVQAISIGVWEDIGLVIAGLVGTGLILYRDRATVVKTPDSARVQAR
jgi:hypothetical protein